MQEGDAFPIICNSFNNKKTQNLNSSRPTVQVILSDLPDLPALRRPDLGETFRGTTE